MFIHSKVSTPHFSSFNMGKKPNENFHLKWKHINSIVQASSLKLSVMQCFLHPWFPIKVTTRYYHLKHTFHPLFIHPMSLATQNNKFVSPVSIQATGRTLKDRRISYSSPPRPALTWTVRRPHKPENFYPYSLLEKPFPPLFSSRERDDPENSCCEGSFTLPIWCQDYEYTTVCGFQVYQTPAYSLTLKALQRFLLSHKKGSIYC